MRFRWPSTSAQEGSRYVGASVSENGTLVYATGRRTDSASQLTWFDRAGQVLGTLGDAARTPASRCHRTNAASRSRWEPEVQKMSTSG